MFDDAEVISAYSRAQALEDGQLVDVSETAREAGFTVPCALTRAAWVQCVEVPPGVQCQDEVGRLWDVLHMLRREIATRRGQTLPWVHFRVYVRNGNRPGVPPVIRLKSVIGPGDTHAPVLTIMCPDED